MNRAVVAGLTTGRFVFGSWAAESVYEGLSSCGFRKNGLPLFIGQGLSAGVATSRAKLPNAVLPLPKILEPRTDIDPRKIDSVGKLARLSLGGLQIAPRTASPEKIAEQNTRHVAIEHEAREPAHGKINNRRQRQLQCPSLRRKRRSSEKV